MSSTLTTKQQFWAEQFSKVSDAVMDRVTEWQSRALEPMYLGGPTLLFFWIASL